MAKAKDKGEGWKRYVLMRDGEPLQIYSSRGGASTWATVYRRGSNHKWSVAELLITPARRKKR